VETHFFLPRIVRLPVSMCLCVLVSPNQLEIFDCIVHPSDKNFRKKKRRTITHSGFTDEDIIQHVRDRSSYEHVSVQSVRDRLHVGYKRAKRLVDLVYERDLNISPEERAKFVKARPRPRRNKYLGDMLFHHGYPVHNRPGGYYTGLSYPNHILSQVYDTPMPYSVGCIRPAALSVLQPSSGTIGQGRFCAHFQSSSTPAFFFLLLSEDPK
jgi:hypothetical protein